MPQRLHDPPQQGRTMLLFAAFGRFPPQDGLPGFRAGVAVRFPAGPAGLPEGRPAGTKDQILIEMEGDFPGELNLSGNNAARSLK